MTKKDISIIIPVGNDILIEKCLDSVSESNHGDNLEVIVIRDHCDKDISKLIEFYKSKLPLIIFDANSDKIGALRNIGIMAAKSDILYFIDSDCILYNEAVKQALKSGSNNPVTRGFIKFTGGASRISKLDAVLRQQRYDLNPNIAYCPNLVVRREVFDRVGLFNEEYDYGSDGEFAKRLTENKIPCSYNQDMKVIHQEPIDGLKIIKTWVKYGEGRGRRFRESSIKEKIQGLFTPNLFDYKKGISYNSIVFACLACRWLGWSKVYLKSKLEKFNK